ncbi:MAG: hypothetical protein ACQEP1_02705 [Nanobdellota archaeon]
MVEFSRLGLFSYNLEEKRKFWIKTAVTFFAIIAVVVLYIVFLRNTTHPILSIPHKIISHIGQQISGQSLLSVFYTALFGGLFFFIIPMEGFFIAFLSQGHNPVLAILLYLTGMFISFNINYFIGLRLRELSKKIISTRKFYKIKATINKYGPPGIFIFNILPFPAQALSAIIGVFRYNRIRFYVYFIAGQGAKYAIISTFYVLVIS